MKKAMLGLLMLVMLAALAACGSSNNATAETGDNGETTSFPEKSIKLVIPYPPGGGTDVLFRLVAQYAEEELGQTIVPTNMAGATATVGSRSVKDADPDGYTILGTHQVVATAEHTGVVDYGFSAFDPVNLITSTPHIPSVSKAFSEENGIENINDLIEYVEEGNKVTWAYTVGSEDHYTIAALLDAAGVDPRSLNYVSYDGTGPQYAAILANQVDGMTGDYASGKGYFDEGTLVPLGMVDEERNPFLPDVPTIIEQGTDFAVTVDRGILAPKGTPEEVKEIISDAFEKALENPELQEKIEELGSFPHYMDTEDYKTHLEELDSKMSELAPKMEF
ncbi:tripartite tricarboxylate transporter substrate binding protein [Aquibacillus albus]|uniref:Tripartite-type tricarboxylate transporter receptor subunit TctC n=1 Tax=Aquibacillus albus TaxID=1168171 RepID=A0ABS2N5C1_9BACI|nr:tripartite tricarboxylate transporter substrate binding protein [Aquibacillus albus]MBM7573350.1 tripartite-type tricarboxylate transporter receptor subunit TctC [Aquibacillus albus]